LSIIEEKYEKASRRDTQERFMTIGDGKWVVAGCGKSEMGNKRKKNTKEACPQKKGNLIHPKQLKLVEDMMQRGKTRVKTWGVGVTWSEGNKRRKKKGKEEKKGERVCRNC